MAQMNDGPTDEELNAAMAVLTDFAAKRLPEGYAVRLGASANGSGLSVVFEDANDVRWVLPVSPHSWCDAVDAAIEDAKPQGRIRRGLIG